MKVVTFKTPDLQVLKLAPIGDFHLGHRACQKEKLEEDIKWLARNKFYTIIMGDLLDNISPFMKPEYYYQPEIDPELPNIRSALRYLKWLLTPLKPRIIGIHMGNHDFDLIRKTENDYIQDLCEQLEANYLEFESFINLVTPEKRTFVIFSTHGHYVGRRIGGKVNRIEDLSAFFEADIYLMGHTHELAGWRRIVLKPHGNKSFQRKKIYALTGSYLLSHGEFSTYAERHGYLPNKIGMLSIEIDLRTRDMHIKE